MTQHQDAAHRVARFLEGYATLRGQDPERITAVRVDDTGDRNLLVSDLKILCYTAFNTPSTPESLAQDAAANRQHRPDVLIPDLTQDGWVYVAEEWRWVNPGPPAYVRD